MKWGKKGPSNYERGTTLFEKNFLNKKCVKAPHSTLFTFSLVSNFCAL